MKKILTIDVETTLHSDKKFKASQHDPSNYIVYLGSKKHDSNTIQVAITPEKKDGVELLTGVNLIVGQNIKFDLTYIRKLIGDDEWRKLLSGKIQVWDTQLAEYLITGQENKTVSLDALSKKYGGTQKDSKVKQYWDAGISTENIPEEEVVPYLTHDVLNTELVALAQMKEATKLKMLPLILSQMDALLAVTECEYNGMHIDVLKANEHIKILESQVAKNEEALKKILLSRGLPLEFLESSDCKLASTKQVAKIIYGGTLKYTTKKQINGAVYKTGKKAGEVKLSNVVVETYLEALEEAQPVLSDKGNIVVDDKQLKLLAVNSPKNKALQEYITNLSEMKLANKSMNTYYKPLSSIKDLLWNHDSSVHHTLNQTTTVTGRLSSSNPNLQNVPRGSTSGVKEIFSSRYYGGYIVEADYSQLEVVVLAWLTNDTQLMYDVSNGVDMHTENAATLFGVSPDKVTKEQRTQAKIGTFQLQYGAGAATICSVFGGDIELAKGLMNAYYTRYPKVKEYFENNMAKLQKVKTKRVDLVKSDKFKTKVYHRTPLLSTQEQAKLVSVTSRRYTFNTYDSPAWSKDLTGFSPTEIKNYPVQGLATADIVPLMLGKIYRNVMLKDSMVNCKLINTVHDSFIFDIKGENVHEFVMELKKEMQYVYNYLLEYFDINFDLPLKAEVDLGRTWADVSAYDKTKEYG